MLLALVANGTPEKFSWSRKFVFRSQNLRGVLNESRNLVFLCLFASQILKFLAARPQNLGFFVCWSMVSIKTMKKLGFFRREWETINN